VIHDAAPVRAPPPSSAIRMSLAKRRLPAFKVAHSIRSLLAGPIRSIAAELHMPGDPKEMTGRTSSSGCSIA